MRCPACQSDLTQEQWDWGECPHCGANFGEQAPGQRPQWDGFQGASLEWDPELRDSDPLLVERFESPPGAVPQDHLTRSDAPSAPSAPLVSYDSKTVAMPLADLLKQEPEDAAAGLSADSALLESALPAWAESSSTPGAGRGGDTRDGAAARSPESPLQTSPMRAPRQRADGAALTPPTSDELQTLAREWGDLEGSATAVTIKPSAEGEEAAPRPRSIHDTVESLPRRRVRASGETLEHPEYELLQMLGEGGMGVVWDARQTSIDRTVAVKMIKGPFADKVTQRRKFLAEAVVTGDLDHPNIVPIYDVGTDIHGKLFYAMKRVQGTPWLHVFRENSLHENLQILLRVADAVAFAHSRGIIHRDIKPENVMLGSFGEVLLMDWGLALPTQEYRKAQSLEFSTGMGGTPAYMAPEMAKGPLDRITTASDVYLLGAILYDIVTGTAPHAATSVRDCLVAAMRNRIVPTDKEGELIDIALKAMATEAEDRHATVQDFQEAVRNYLAHEESLSLAARAREDLHTAERTDDYRDYARAVFGFEEAFELWDGNRDARRGIFEAKLAYARSARGKGDYDLGLSLLDADRPDHRALRQQLTEARDEARARQRRLQVARRVTLTTASLAFCVVAGALVFIYRAFKSEQVAVARLDDANTTLEQQKADLIRTVGQRDEAILDRQKALENEQEQREAAEIAQMDAERARMDEEKERQAAEAARDTARMERTAAEKARAQAVAARKQEEYKAYVAGIGAAAARIDEGAFDVARSILEDFARPGEDADQESGAVKLINWEWGRLMYLCQLYSEQRTAEAPVDALAVSPDGVLLATGSRDRFARIQDLATGNVLAELPHGGTFVHSVAWSPDGRWLATGSSSHPDGFVQLWDAAAILAGGNAVGRPLAGHTLPVTRVRFSRDGSWLLSCSFDKTAKIWDLSDPAAPRLAHTLVGHNWWVWDGAFSPDFNPENPDVASDVVTVDQDGQVILWSNQSPGATDRRPGPASGPREFRKDRLFTGHEGPVYSVDYVRLGEENWIATGGYDNRVLVWRPEDAQEYTVEAVFDPPPQRQGNYRELRGHSDAVQSVSFSADGTLLVTAGRDNSVWIWSMESEGQKFRLRGHSSEVRSAVVTPNGRQVVSAGLDQQILLWNTDGDQELKVLPGQHFSRHDDAVLAARFSHDDSEIITASSDRTARIWDSRSAARIAELREGHAYLVSSAVLFPDGLTLATAAADGTVRLWDVPSGAERLTLKETGRSGVLALSRDAAWLVTGGPEHTARLWAMDGMTLDPGGTPESHPLAANTGHVTAAACSPTADLVVTGDVNGRTVLWNIATREPVWNVRLHPLRVNAVRFTPDGRDVLVASSDKSVSRVDVATGQLVARVLADGPVTALDISDDGAQAALAQAPSTDEGGAQAMVLTWDLRQPTPSRRIGPLEAAVQSIMITPGGGTALIAGNDNTVRSLPLDGSAEPGPPVITLERDYGALAAAMLSDDGQRLVTMNGSDARLFDTAGWSELMAFRPQDALADAEFSPDGTLIITASWDGTVRFWDATQRPPVAVGTLAAHDQFINSAVFSPDGELILTASDDRTAKIWNTRTRERVWELKGHSAAVNRAVFSRDGGLVLTVSDDMTARIWDALTGEPVGEPLQGDHSRPILCGAFSADGKRVATGSDDNQALLWSVANRTPVAVLGGHTAAVTAIAFSADDARVFTGSRDSTVKVWDVSEDGLRLSSSTVAGDAVGRVRAVDLLTLSGHRREVTSLTVSSDGQKVLTGSRDQTAIIWNAAEWPLPPQDAPVAALPAAAPRNP